MKQDITQLKILLVEDNIMAQKGAILVLSSLGHEVDVVDCGEKAIALFAPNKYALIFMDIGLPDMKGYQVAKRFREIEEGTGHHAPILGLSAHVTEEEKRLSATAGIDEMHFKPLLLDQTKVVLKQYAIVTPALTVSNMLTAEDEELTIIDLAKIREGLSTDREVVCALLDELIVSLPAFRVEIERAFKAKDIPPLIEKLHQFHGGLCYTNTPHLLHAVREVEVGLKNGEGHRMDALYQNLLNAIDMFEKTYNTIRLILPIYGTMKI